MACIRISLLTLKFIRSLFRDTDDIPRSEYNSKYNFEELMRRYGLLKTVLNIIENINIPFNLVRKVKTG